MSPAGTEDVAGSDAERLCRAGGEGAAGIARHLERVIEARDEEIRRLRATREDVIRGGPYGERIGNEGLAHLESMMLDERPFTEDSAMVAYRLTLDAIRDLRELRDIRESTLAIGRFSGIEEAAKLMEENAECFTRSGQRELAYQLTAEARHIRDLVRSRTP